MKDWSNIALNIVGTLSMLAAMFAVFGGDREQATLSAAMAAACFAARSA